METTKDKYEHCLERLSKSIADLFKPINAVIAKGLHEQGGEIECIIVDAAQVAALSDSEETSFKYLIERLESELTYPIKTQPRKKCYPL